MGGVAVRQVNEKAIKPERVERALHAMTCLHLRQTGLTYAEIAHQTNSVETDVYRVIRRELEQMRKTRTEVIENVRNMELSRLDRMLVKCMAAVEEGDLTSVDRVIKIMDRRAKYLGLDAPAKTELVGGGAVLIIPDNGRGAYRPLASATGELPVAGAPPDPSQLPEPPVL